MRTLNATFHHLLPIPMPAYAPPDEGGAAAAAPAGGEAAAEHPDTAQGEGTLPEGEKREETFESAFAALTAPEPVAPTPKPTAPTAQPAAAAPAEGGGLPEVGADGRPVAPTPPAPAAAATPPANETAEQKAAREAQERQPSANETPEQKAAREAQERQPAPQPAPQPQQGGDDTSKIMAALRGIIEGQPQGETTEPERPAYTPEQQAIVDNYKKEWPEHYAAQELIRKVEYEALTRYIFSEIAPALQAVMGQTSQVAAVTHEQQLAHLVPDYAEVRGPVVEWIGKQPDFLKVAYEGVAKNGTAQQVADMIDIWRTQANKPKPAAAAAPPAPAGRQPAAPAPAAPKPQPPARPVAALAPVATLRGGVPQAGADPNDYDTAFAAAAKAAAA